MGKLKVMVNGLPGNMAGVVARQIYSDDRFDLLPHSLTGPEISATEHTVEGFNIRLIDPDARKAAITELKNSESAFISVDYTHPAAVNENAQFYCNHSLPFVMGTTGGDRKLLEDTVAASSIPAVIAPNMAKQIVGFQAMVEYAAETFPGLFKGYSLQIRESHQEGKADTSGTAKAMVKYFNALGTPFSTDEIVMERDPAIQKASWGIPEEYLAGHGWHTYTLVSDDKTVRFEFSHNVNGREVYGKGTLDAVLYLSEKISAGAEGKIYTMIDVLKGS
ncbi:MAG: dihydrodipicolinate reductase [Deltaproteobacteria bacterium]|nr:MAG: dihydrodipicolinate reductase [Deltaproteobacteria bacterium]